LQIPLLLWIPGRQASRSDVWASQVDFLPTLLAASNLPVPPSLTGRDLLSSPDRGHHYAELAWLPVGERNLTPDWMTPGVFVSLTWGEWHYEHVWRDEREFHNLYDSSRLTVVEDKSRAAAARAVLAEHYESAMGALLRDAAMDPDVDSEAEKEHIETLRDLGYM
jgi:arylsulfatase A-like enzyme